MKKVYYLFLMFSVSLLCSCSADFLNLAPSSNLTDGNYFKTEGHFEQTTNGIYESLRGVVGRSGYLMGEQRSDNTHYTFDPANRTGAAVEAISDFINDSQNYETNAMYGYCYTGIARANTVLNRLSRNTFSSDFCDKIEGQAKFLRAFLYFQLVQCYGEVSLHLEEVVEQDKAFLPRSSVEAVYEAILKDADDAVKMLKAPSFPQTGVATQGAARMLRAYALMTKPQPDYSAAEADLTEIIKMGYDLVENYSKVFDTTNKNSIESIFEVQFQQDLQDQYSEYVYHMLPKTADTYLVTKIQMSNNYDLGGWNVPTQEMIDSYEEGDLRLSASVGVVAGHIDSNSNMFVYEKVFTPKDDQIRNYPNSYYFVNKYNHKHSTFGRTDDNWPVYRYADALLLLAESLVAQNRAGEALSYVNAVRDRAGLSAVSTVTAATVANERRHELAFENHRWYDLIRTGKAIEVMTEHGKRMKALYPYLLDATYKINSEDLLFPIPLREIQVNTLFIQNPGY